jgi:serine/alanine adding enzyme
MPLRELSKTMATIIKYQDNPSSWDDYVYNNNTTTIYHNAGWKKIIERTFSHTSHFFMAQEDGAIRGILPLILIDSRIFGRQLISLPFIDSGGLIADRQDIASLLCDKAMELAQSNKVDFCELRNPVEIKHHNLITAFYKVNFILTLDHDPNFLWKNVFHENIRNKVRKAIKNNLLIKTGNNDYFINHFYTVFSVNMRYLGTPVYPLNFFKNMAREFPQNMLIFLVYYANKVIGGKVVFFFRDTVYFINHSSLRGYANLAPNNFLYWAVIEYACNNGYKFCNMGRSTKDSGPYNFKKQWGGEPRQLYWQYYLNKGNQVPNLSPSNLKFSRAISIWKRLPLRLTQIIGPLISRHIP